jgi:hypothetical protein
MVNAHTTTQHSTTSKKDDDNKSTSTTTKDSTSTTSKEVKEEILTTPEHSFKEIETQLNIGNNRDQILDYIVDALGGLTGRSLSEQQIKSLKNTVNKNLLNKLD